MDANLRLWFKHIFSDREKDFLLKADQKDINASEKKEFEKATAKMKIKIIYESIYREKDLTLRWP